MTLITVSQLNQAWTFGGSEATLRIYAHEPFHASDGTFLVGGKIGSSKIAYDIECSLAVQDTIIVPEIELHSTDDSRDRPDVLYSAVFYDEDGNAVQELLMNFPVPHDIPEPTSWTALAIYGETGELITGSASYQPIDDDLTDIANLNANDDDIIQRKSGEWTNRSVLEYKDDLNLGYVSVSDYASLASAVSTLGATETTLLIDEDVTLSSALVIPSTLVLDVVPGKLITKSSGTIEFQGIGLKFPESQIPIFSGFSSGNITWTGTHYPKRLSASLWTDVSRSTRESNAMGAMAGKAATIVTHPIGHHTAKVTVTNGLAIHFTKGTYTSTNVGVWLGGDRAMYILQNNTRAYGDGVGQTIMEESSGDQASFFYASGAENGPFDGANNDIEINDITFETNPGTTTNSALSAIFLGNCIKAKVHHCAFHNTHGFAIYGGAFGTAGNQADGFWITDNYISGLRTQNIGTVGGRNVHIERNTIVLRENSGAPFTSVIDIEPNDQTTESTTLVISNNIIDARASLTTCNGMDIQLGGAPVGRNVTVTGNQVIGGELTHSTCAPASVDLVNNSIDLVGHGFLDGQIISPTSAFGLGTPPAPLIADGGYIAIIDDSRTIKFATSYADWLTRTPIDLTTQGTGTLWFYGGRNLINGISVIGYFGGVVANNLIRHAGQSGMQFLNSGNLLISNNMLQSCNTSMYVYSSYDNIFSGNVAQNLGGVPVSSNNYLIEVDVTRPVTTTSGSATIGMGGYRHELFRTVGINGTDYTMYEIDLFLGTVKLNTTIPVTLGPFTFVDGDVSTGADTITEAGHGLQTGCALALSTTGVVPTGLASGTVYYAIRIDANTFQLAASYADAVAGTEIDISAAAGGGTHTLTPHAICRFSTNYYDNNDFSYIQLSPVGYSKIRSAANRVVHDSAPFVLSASQNDWTPSTFAYRLDITPTGAWNITGIQRGASDFPFDGEEHLIYNAGASNITLKNEDLASTAYYRLHSVNGADVVILPGQKAKLIYSTTLSRWIISLEGDVGLTATQTLTNKTLEAPVLTTPDIGAAIGTSLNLGSSTLLDILTATAALNFDLTAVATQDLTIAVTGAALGDAVMIGVPHGSITTDTNFWGWVSAADTVTIRATRISGTPDPASGTFRATVLKF
jgi:hypothetical protein